MIVLNEKTKKLHTLLLLDENGKCCFHDFVIEDDILNEVTSEYKNVCSYSMSDDNINTWELYCERMNKANSFYFKYKSTLPEEEKKRLVDFVKNELYCSSTHDEPEVLLQVVKEFKRELGEKMLNDKLSRELELSLKEIWEQLGDVPVNDDGEIEEIFFNYPVGTDREEIWHDIEKYYDITIGELLNIGEKVFNKLPEMTQKRFHTITRNIHSIGVAMGKLHAYNAVTSNTWGVISINLEDSFENVHNELNELSNCAVRAYREYVNIHALETKVNEILKVYRLR